MLTMSAERELSTDAVPFAARCALGHLASRYIAARRSSGDLRGRLIAATQERSRLAEAVAGGDTDERARDRLAEADRVRATLERSAHACAEQTAALEAVIAAVAVQLSLVLPPRHASPDGHAAAALTLFPDAGLRGGWSAPIGS